MAAVTFGAIGLITAVVVIGFQVVKGDRPEEEVAAQFLDALFDGRGEDVYGLTTPAYRSIVFPEDLAQLSQVLSRTVGAFDIEVLGSERTPGSEPPDSYVGYQGTSRIGTVEGVIVLVELGESGWYVRDISYRFPEASDDQTRALFELTEALNEQFADRATKGPLVGQTPGPSPSP